MRLGRRWKGGTFYFKHGAADCVTPRWFPKGQLHDYSSWVVAVYVRLNFGRKKVQELPVRELADAVIGYVVYLLGSYNAAYHFFLETT